MHCRFRRTSKYSKRKTTHFESHSRSESFKIKKFITWGTTYVTYLLACPCELQYVGRTTRKLGIRLSEHVNNIKKGYKHHRLSNHFRLYHGRDSSGLTFCGIDRVDAHWRGSILKRAISQDQTQWIHCLGTMSALGLNIELDLNCFLYNW